MGRKKTTLFEYRAIDDHGDLLAEPINGICDLGIRPIEYNSGYVRFDKNGACLQAPALAFDADLPLHLKIMLINAISEVTFGSTISVGFCRSLKPAEREVRPGYDPWDTTPAGRWQLSDLRVVMEFSAVRSVDNNGRDIWSDPELAKAECGYMYDKMVRVTERLRMLLEHRMNTKNIVSMTTGITS